MQQIRTALLSFGMSGRVFHAPFIQLHSGFTLVGAWERSKKNIEQAYPGTVTYDSLEELLGDKMVDLVVVNTPTLTHFEYAKKALLAGKDIIVEKAFTTTLAEAIELKEIAQQQNKKIGVFQNRRWDSDFRTVQKILQEGLLGNINEAEFHFDRFNLALSPKQHKEIPSPGSGILKDLGPHLIDQALCLFGMPQSVFADIRITRKISVVDDYFNLLLYYPDFRVILRSALIVKEPVPSYILHGDKGSFLKQRGDVQEANLLAGLKPDNNEWGTEPEIAAGILNVDKDGNNIYEKVKSSKGNYCYYYDGVYQALTSDKPMPVTVDDGINVMKVIDAAIKSNAERRVIDIIT